MDVSPRKGAEERDSFFAEPNDEEVVEGLRNAAAFTVPSPTKVFIVGDLTFCLTPLEE